jgi:hypothetical protein
MYTDYDDGYYQEGSDISPRFTDNNDGTITDNVTGLMWVKDGSGAGCNNGSQTDWTNSISFCHGLTFAGHSDWRLPNVNELFSIINHSLSYPAVDTTFFPNTQPSYYWTSTTGSGGTTFAETIYLYNGQMNYDYKTSAHYVRPVRKA